MGIYDREYVRVGPHSKSGLGSLRFISINSWIILINVAVFLLGATVLNRPREWTVGPAWAEGVTQAQKDRAQTDLSIRQSYTGARYPTLAHPIFAPALDSSGRQLTDAFGRPLMVQIGYQLFIEMPLLEGLGHFSTLKAFFGLEVWRFITFQFLHANISHIFFNMFGLWVFGGMVEQYLGSKRYLAFYLTCGIFGGVSYLILNALGAAHVRIPGVIVNEIWTPLIGASAGVFGVILACAYIAPEAIVQLIFPPIPLKLKWFAYGYVGLAALNLLRGGNNAGGDAAHMGGAIAGAFFIRNAHLLRDFFDIFGGRKGAPRGRGTDSGEIDRILAKVQTQGLASLTAGEKQALRTATDRQKRG